MNTSLNDGADYGQPIDPAAENIRPQWYYLFNDRECGPKTTEEIMALLSSGVITASTYVFRDGMTDWAEAGSLQDFRVRTGSEPHTSSHVRPQSPSSPPPIGRTASSNQKMKAIPKPTASNVAYLIAGSLAALVIIGLMGGIKPLGNWRLGMPIGDATGSSAENGNGDPQTRAIVSRSKDKNAMQILAVYRNVDSIIGSQDELRTIKFSELWADTETYFDHAFLFCGTIRLPKKPAFLPGGARHGEIDSAVGPDTHSQIVIVSSDKSRSDTEDHVFGFAGRDLAKDLISLLGADEQKTYTGCFLLKIPTELKYINLYKESGGALSIPYREVKCEVFAYGPDESTLRQAIILAKRAESKENQEGNITNTITDKYKLRP